MSCYKGARHIADLSEATQPGTRYKVQWADVPDRDAATVSIRKQFTAEQVTRSRKLEGAWWGDGGAYFVASFARTADGSVNEHDGQVWFYDPRVGDGHPEDDLRGQPGPRSGHRLRRPRQHHRFPVRRGHPRRGRRGRLSTSSA